MGLSVLSMQDRGVTGDDALAAMTMGIAFAVISFLLLVLALKIRQTRYFDRYGEPVAADGSSLAFMMMGYHHSPFVSDESDDFD